MRIKIKKWTLGMDNEYLILDKNDNPISGIGKVGGTKNRPLDIGKACGRQEDNVAAEVTMPPCTTAEELLYYVNYTKNTVEKHLNLKGANLRLVAQSSAIFDESQLLDRAAKIFGCSGSFCVYTGGGSQRKSASEAGNLRAFGAHVHVGWVTTQKKNIQDIERLIRTMDILLTVPSILIDPDTKRRELYGNAGDFRFKSYGCELRTLGSGMIANDSLVKFIFDQTTKAIELCNNDTFDPYQYEERVLQAVDQNNLEVAKTLCSEFNININHLIPITTCTTS